MNYKKISKFLLIWQFVWFLFLLISIGIGVLTTSIVKNGKEDQIGVLAFLISGVILLIFWAISNFYLYNKLIETNKVLFQRYFFKKEGIKWVDLDIKSFKFWAYISSPIPFLMLINIWSLNKWLKRLKNKIGHNL